MSHLVCKYSHIYYAHHDLLREYVDASRLRSVQCPYLKRSLFERMYALYVIDVITLRIACPPPGLFTFTSRFQVIWRYYVPPLGLVGLKISQLLQKTHLDRPFGELSSPWLSSRRSKWNPRPGVNYIEPNTSHRNQSVVTLILGAYSLQVRWGGNFGVGHKLLQQGGDAAQHQILSGLVHFAPLKHACVRVCACL